MSINVQTS